ncbi:MAG TPA: RNA polymerase sigma factor [Gammaproteobacteria bacterium]
MREVRAGRTGALATLFERHHARLYRFCLRMTGNRQIAEDLVQDVFMRILKYRTSYKDEVEFAPWMFRIARNACADHLRRDAHEAPLSDERMDEHEANAAAGEPAGDGRAELVRRALLALPADRREVLVLSRYEFKSYEEIARTLGCSVGAVKVRVHRAIKELRRIYLELAQEVCT